MKRGLSVIFRYLSRDLSPMVHNVSGTGVGTAGAGFGCAAGSLDELEEVLLQGALVAGNTKIHRLG